MRRTLFTTILLLVCASASAQRDWSAVEIEVIKAGGSVYMLKGAGGNIGVSSGDDGIILIDDQYAPLAPKIMAALKTISDKPIRFILNTHHHGDHTGGNEVFSREATIIAHENVRKRLESGDPPAAKAALPIITFDNRLTLHFNGEDVRTIHYPSGHTDNDSVIYFTKSNVVHMGDDFFNGRFPFIDIDNGGSVKGYIAAVEKILATIPDDVKIIPGHGPLTDKPALRGFLDMLKGSSDAVARGIKAGKSLEALKQEKVLAPWEKWSWQFISSDTFTEILYKDLKK